MRVEETVLHPLLGIGYGAVSLVKSTQTPQGGDNGGTVDLLTKGPRRVDAAVLLGSLVDVTTVTCGYAEGDNKDEVKLMSVAHWEIDIPSTKEYNQSAWRNKQRGK